MAGLIGAVMSMLVLFRVLRQWATTLIVMLSIRPRYWSLWR